MTQPIQNLATASQERHVRPHHRKNEQQRCEGSFEVGAELQKMLIVALDKKRWFDGTSSTCHSTFELARFAGLVITNMNADR